MVDVTIPDIATEETDPVGGDLVEGAKGVGGASFKLQLTNLTKALSASILKTLYEGNGDTNAFTDALLSKLNAIEALADVTDDVNVRAALAAATADIAVNSQKITGLGAPANSNDAATKDYVDSTAAGLDWKDSVRAASDGPGTLATDFENGDTMDGVVLATNDRILLKDQADATENGIRIVQASGAPIRAPDADANAEVTANLTVFVEEGTSNADTSWTLTTNDPITVDVTSLTFAQFTGAGRE